MISPQFVKGGRLKTGKYDQQFHLVRPYNAKGVNGIIHMTKCNYTQIGLLSGCTKDQARTSIERVFKRLSNEVRKKNFTEVILPTVGVFSVRNQVAAVAFDQGLAQDSHDITNKHKSAIQRKVQSKNFITIDNMDQFHLSRSGYNVNKYEGRFLGLDESANNYLKSLNIDTKTLHEGRNFRPMTASCNYDHLSTSNISKRRNSMRRGSSASGSRGSKANKTFRTTTKPGFFVSQNITDHPHSIQNLAGKFSNSLAPQRTTLDNDRLISIAKRKIGLWIRESRMPVIDAFFEIIGKELGKNVVRTIEIASELFAKCLVLMNVGIDSASALEFANDIIRAYNVKMGKAHKDNSLNIGNRDIGPNECWSTNSQKWPEHSTNEEMKS